MALSDAITWTTAQIATITGIDAASGPTDTMGVNGLVAMVYDSSGTFGLDAYRDGRDLSTIRIILLYPRSDLKSAIAALTGKPQAIADKIRLDPTMGGYVSTFDAINYQFVTIPWQAIDAAGYQIDITGVKIRRVLT
jgi:hypothetical protein